MERLQLKIETNSYAISTPARASYEEHTSQFDCPQEIVTGQDTSALYVERTFVTTASD